MLSSHTRTASSMPIANPCLSASLLTSGPTVNTLVLTWWLSLSSTASVTEYSSHGLMTSCASPHVTVPDAFTSTLAAVSGVLLVITTTPGKKLSSLKCVSVAYHERNQDKFPER